MDGRVDANVVRERQVDGPAVRTFKLVIKPPRHDSFPRVCWS